MRLGPIKLLLFLSAAIGQIAPAQRHIFRTFSVNDGLVHNFVRRIFQDSRGFMWIGTWEGLSKYDGYRFTNFTTLNELSNDFITDIFESPAGIIYISCIDGSLYRTGSDGMLRKINSVNSSVNRFVSISKNKILALVAHNGIQEFSEGKLVPLPRPSPALDYDNLIPFNDSLYLANDGFAIQLLDRQFQLFAELRDTVQTFAECGILKDTKNRVWVGTIKGIRLLSPVQQKGRSLRFLDLPPAFSHPFLQSRAVRAILEDDGQNIWFGTGSGLLKIGADGSPQVFEGKNGLRASDVNCICQDRAKNIWVGGSRGMARINTTTSITIFGTGDESSSDWVGHIMPIRNGDILAERANGTMIYKRSSGTFEEASQPIYVAEETDKKLSVHPAGLHSYFLILKQSSSHFSLTSPAPIGEYYAFEDSTGNYFSAFQSPVIVSRDLKNWQKIFSASDVRTVMLDTKGYLWAGTADSGLLRIRYEYKDHIPRIKEQKLFLPGTGIRSLYEDTRGRIWAGSRFDGVFILQFHSDTPLVTHFNQKSGLSSNRITSMAEDNKGVMWLSYYGGLDKLIPDKNSLRVFNFSRVHNFYTSISSMAFTKDHSLWLGTADGLVNISDGENENAEPLNTFITSARFSDSMYRGVPEQKISLDHRNKQVQFEFAAPGSVNENQVLFSYRLLGSNNEDWSEANHEHSVSFANLRSGSYQFEVRSMGWNRQWGKAASFAFFINPPFWETSWFRILAAAVVAAAIFYIFRRRIKSIRHEAGMKQKISETEMMAFRAQMNPHFIFNCLNSIDSLIQTNQKEKATTYLARFAKLIRNVLDGSKNNAIPLQKELESLELYLQMEQLRSNDKFEYTVKADPEMFGADYKVPPLVIQPFVENAIQHGLLNKKAGEKKLFISVITENDFLKFTIVDNGVGRNKAGEINALNKPGHVSDGISITRERIQRYNQNVNPDDVVITDLYENDQPAGTKVEVQIKIREQI